MLLIHLLTIYNLLAILGEEHMDVPVSMIKEHMDVPVFMFKEHMDVPVSMFKEHMDIPLYKK